MRILHFVFSFSHFLWYLCNFYGQVIFYLSFFSSLSLLWLNVWLSSEMLIANANAEELYRPRSLLLALTDDTLSEYYFEWIIMNYLQF